jgi:hypothetical protein
MATGSIVVKYELNDRVCVWSNPAPRYRVRVGVLAVALEALRRGGGHKDGFNAGQILVSWKRWGT